MSLITGAFQVGTQNPKDLVFKAFFLSEQTTFSERANRMRDNFLSCDPVIWLTITRKWLLKNPVLTNCRQNDSLVVSEPNSKNCAYLGNLLVRRSVCVKSQALPSVHPECTRFPLHCKKQRRLAFQNLKRTILRF